MKIVVTGSAGLVGSNIVRTLLNSGDTVTAMVHRDRRALEGLDVTIAAGDIEDVDSLRGVFAGVDAVVHSAGYVSIRKNEWDKLQRLNVHSTHNVAQACLDTGVKKLVYISSVHALKQEPLDEPLDENRDLALGSSFTPYDQSKAMAELEIQQAAQQGLHTIILRPTAVIGPHDYHPSALGKAIYYLSSGKWPAVVQGGFDWVDARDVGQGVCQALQLAPSGSHYLVTGTWTSVLELAERISAITGCFCPKIAFPLWTARLVVPVGDLVATRSRKEQVFTSATLGALDSNTHICRKKAEGGLGYSPRPLDETLRDTITWFKQNPPAL